MGFENKWNAMSYGKRIQCYYFTLYIILHFNICTKLPSNCAPVSSQKKLDPCSPGLYSFFSVSSVENLRYFGGRPSSSRKIMHYPANRSLLLSRKCVFFPLLFPWNIALCSKFGHQQLLYTKARTELMKNYMMWEIFRLFLLWCV